MAGNSNFVKCVNLYPEATMALAQFRDFVQQKCLVVLERHLDPLRKAVGYNGELQDPAGYSDPDRPAVGKVDYFEIGAKTVQEGKVKFHSGVYWEMDSSCASGYDIGLFVSVWFGSADLRSQLKTEVVAAKQEDPRFRNQEWSVSEVGYPAFCLTLSRSEFLEFDRHLEKLLKWAIAVFKSRPKVRRLVSSWKPAR